jgi:hypothetical protein
MRCLEPADAAHRCADVARDRCNCALQRERSSSVLQFLTGQLNIKPFHRIVRG